jgi:hypothetical protein
LLVPEHFLCVCVSESRGSKGCWPKKSQWYTTAAVNKFFYAWKQT